MPYVQFLPVGQTGWEHPPLIYPARSEVCRGAIPGQVPQASYGHRSRLYSTVRVVHCAARSRRDSSNPCTSGVLGGLFGKLSSSAPYKSESANTTGSISQMLRHASMVCSAGCVGFKRARSCPCHDNTVVCFLFVTVNCPGVCRMCPATCPTRPALYECCWLHVRLPHKALKIIN